MSWDSTPTEATPPGTNAADRGVQRANAAHRSVRIGALIEQKQGERVLAADDRERQDMGAVGARRVDVDPGGDQRLGHRHVPVARCIHQGGVPHGRRSRRVGPSIKQRAHDLRGACVHGPHHCRRLQLHRGCVDVRAVSQERLYRL